MAIALVTSVDVASGGPTAGVNTTGASLLVMFVSYSSTEGTPSDSLSNTWTPLTSSYTGGTASGRLYYVANPTVGASHTFSVGGAGFPSISVAAFSGVKTVTPLDKQNGGSTAGATTLQPGSVTPAEDNELVVTGIADDGGAITLTINGGYTITQQEAWGSGVNLGSGLAYIVQTTAGATNPTWTLSSSLPAAATIATFKVAAAAAGSRGGAGFLGRASAAFHVFTQFWGP